MVFIESATGKIHGLYEPTVEELAEVEEMREELYAIVHHLRRDLIFRERAPSWRYPLPLQKDSTEDE